MKCTAERHFIDTKWGPARIIGTLPMGKIKVLYLGHEKKANEWEACRVNEIPRQS
jgi:hypothetical protein